MKNLKNIMFSIVLMFSTFAILNVSGFTPTEAIVSTLVVTSIATVASKSKSFSGAFVTICGAITLDIKNDCDLPLQAGTHDKAVIINQADIEAIGYGADGQTVESITLLTGKQGVQIDGKYNSIMPSFAMIKVGFNKLFDHTVSMKGFDISPAIKKDLNSAKDGKFVVVVENYFKGTDGNSSFEIFGITAGLDMSVLSRDANNQESQGAFDFTLTTEINKEPRVPSPLFDTDYATTKAIFDALLIPAV